MENNMKVFICLFLSLFFINLAISNSVSGKNIKENNAYDTCKCKNELKNLENRIYFDMWYNSIVEKNKNSSLFVVKDPFYGDEIDTKFKINKNI